MNVHSIKVGFIFDVGYTLACVCKDNFALKKS